MVVDDCLTNKEIAEKTYRSEDTIATTKKNIYRKLNIRKVTELSKLYFKGSLMILIITGITINTHVDSNRRNRRYRRREVETFIPTHFTESH